MTTDLEYQVIVIDEVDRHLPSKKNARLALKLVKSGGVVAWRDEPVQVAGIIHADVNIAVDSN